MKKLMLSVFFMVGIFVLASQGELLWSSRLLLDEARIHKIQKNESLSLLAKRYYGDASRWRELALVNRAPNPNLVLPGEEILVPAVGPINELRQARTITQVASVVGEQERLAVAETQEAARQFTNEPAPITTSPEPATNAMTESTPEATEPMMTGAEPEVEPALTNEIEESSGFPWFWLVVALVLVGGVFAFMAYRRRSAKSEPVAEEEPARPLNRAEEILRERRRHSENVTQTV